MKTSKTLLLSLAVMCVLGAESYAQVSMDVVYLKDGSRIVGTIVELIPNESLTFRATDGTVYVFDWDRVDRLTREDIPAGDAVLTRRGVESWYTYWAIGYAHNTYPASLQSRLDALERDFGASHVSLALDILGFYWPLRDQQTLIGFIISGAADRYSYRETASQVNLYLYSVSAMHFFGEVPGDGFFVRLDGGYAAALSSFFVEAKSGVGFLAGAGYGIPVSDETRILLHAGFSYRGVGGESHNTISVTIGGLF